MHYNYAKESAHLKRAAWHDSHGNTQKALAHFGRALYFGAKRGREEEDTNMQNGEQVEQRPKKKTVKESVKESSDRLDSFLADRAAVDEITSGLGAMHVRPEPPARRMSHYGR